MIEALVTDRSGTLLLGTDVDTGTATFNADRTYRYALTRTWDTHTAPVVFIMLNPSKAGAVRADPTIRRCIGYGRQWGAGGVIGLNLFGLVSTDPAALLTHPDPVGPGNDEQICAALHQDLLTCVVAWGAHPAAVRRVGRVVDLIRWAGHKPWCLAVTRGGDPGHPLYQRADTRLLRWPQS